MLESIAHPEWDADIDYPVRCLRRWVESAPAWPPADDCRRLIDRFAARVELLRARLAAPLVIGVIGGTGVGKSSLVNALVGAEISPVSKLRPTTNVPRLIVPPGIRPEMLGISPDSVEVVEIDRPITSELILVDCPDPDTSDPGNTRSGTPEAGEEGEASQASVAADNLARLRAILPHCDVLLLVSTQQKYRSAAVHREWIKVAPSTQWVFVQTHADCDSDIRDDWRQLMTEAHDAPFFFVDSLRALEAMRANRPLPGEFAALLDYLRRTFNRTARDRLRRANVIGAADNCLRRCGELLAARLPAVRKLREEAESRQRELIERMNAALLSAVIEDRRNWEQQLLASIVQRWGASPFAMLLRLYQSLGDVLIWLGASRARSGVQLALWGAVAAVHKLRQWGEQTSVTDNLVSGLIDEQSLREAAFVLRGFAREAQVSAEAIGSQIVRDELERSEKAAVVRLRSEINEILSVLVRRNSRWWVRVGYESAWLAVVGLVLFRLGKNFFYDSWWAVQPVPIESFHAYAAGAFWIVVWSAMLLVAFSGRLRRSIRRALRGFAARRLPEAMAEGPFRMVIEQCTAIEAFAAECDRLRGELTASTGESGTFPAAMTA